MQVRQLTWNAKVGWHGAHDIAAQLVVYFGARETLADATRFAELKAMFPSGYLIGCSTGGQISGDDVSDNEIAAVAMHFDATQLRLACEPVAAPDASRVAGEAIGRKLKADDLAGIFILSDGLNVNGSELVAGIAQIVGGKVPLTGGLAGDGSLFVETLVGADCAPRSHTVAAIGFYGDAVRIGHGSAGGWDVFGPNRRITKSTGNVLFELDSEPALNLYERYLGDDESKGLPGSALLFPLQIHDPKNKDEVVRTVLAIDREARSMTFAGDVPQGWVAQLMRGNFEHLAQGAATAARSAQTMIGEHGGNNGVALMVSCIGRRLLMGQSIADEIEVAGKELGPRLARIGFYSYGEISPHVSSGACGLHNQTMTVTTITEATA